MDQFLDSFEDAKQQELARLQELEDQIAALLESMSRNLSAVGHLPSSQTFSTMKEDLAFKEGEVEKSRNTLEGLSREHQQLSLNLEKIEALEEKIRAEMATLKEKMTRMEGEMETFSNLEQLRREAEERRARLEVGLAANPNGYITLLLVRWSRRSCPGGGRGRWAVCRRSPASSTPPGRRSTIMRPTYNSPTWRESGR